MSGYIINPMWFYWVDVLGGLKFTFGVFAAIAVVGGITFGIALLCFEYIEEEEKPKVIDEKRIIFDDENNKRHMIYWTTGTVIIDEN